MAKPLKVEVSYGAIWLTGWLFTLGYTDAGFWKGILDLLLWPFFLGAALAG